MSDITDAMAQLTEYREKLLKGNAMVTTTGTTTGYSTSSALTGSAQPALFGITYNDIEKLANELKKKELTVDDIMLAMEQADMDKGAYVADPKASYMTSDGEHLMMTLDEVVDLSTNERIITARVGSNTTMSDVLVAELRVPHARF